MDADLCQPMVGAAMSVHCRAGQDLAGRDLAWQYLAGQGRAGQDLAVKCEWCAVKGKSLQCRSMQGLSLIYLTAGELT